MKILILSSFLPYPLFSGGHVRLYNLMKQLTKRHELTLVCEKREHQTQSDVKTIEALCKKVVFVERKKQWSFYNVLKTAFTQYPFLMIGHTQKNLQTKIQELLQAEVFDLVHIETFYVMQNLPKVTIPTVLVEHNIEYLVYKRFVQNASLMLRPLLMLDILKMKYWEKFFWEKATKLVSVSNQEKELMNRKDVIVVPNGVDVAKFKVKSSKLKVEQKEKTILFIGDFKWIQNRDAAELIIKEIWPSFVHLWRTSVIKPKIKLWIVGRSIPESIKKLTNDQNVIFDENAPVETEKIFEQTDILLAPIRIGGGTSYKILEAMASGVPVITTKLGIEGIEAEDGKDVLLADSAEDFMKQVYEVLQNKTLYGKIVANARVLVEKQYNWEMIVKKLEEVYISAKRSYEV